MVEVLVILDGASEPLRAGASPTSLERARTPALDRLAREGELSRLRTVAPWLAPGSEVAIPALLGWTPGEPVDRASIEAAAHGIAVPRGARVWRVDVRGTSPGVRPEAGEVARRAAAVQAAVLHCAVHRLAGHRLLIVGRAPLPRGALAGDLLVWPEGVVPARVLGADTVVVGARGAAIGVARLMGAATIVPAGATGLPASDLAAKAAAVLRAVDAGAARVVVHVGGPDEAAHQHDRAAKVAAIERADRDLVAPLAAAVARAGGRLSVCPDHGCDPASGEHDGAPVPCVTWSRVALHHELGRILEAPRRLTERAVEHLPVVAPPARHAGVAA